jgi:hypothetical protein
MLLSPEPVLCELALVSQAADVTSQPEGISGGVTESNDSRKRIDWPEPVFAHMGENTSMADATRVKMNRMVLLD